MSLELLIKFYRNLDTDARSHEAYRGTLRALKKLIWEEYERLR